MNERIEKLAEQAADYANTYSDAGADVWFEIYNKKFAELILEECAKTIQAQDVDPSFKNRMSWAIKKQFGVEE